MPVNRHHVPVLPLRVTEVLDGRVRVVLLSVEASVLDYEAEGIVHEPAVAALVAIAIALHEILFRERDELACLDSVHKRLQLRVAAKLPEDLSRTF